jgi:hypothetical protein
MDGPGWSGALQMDTAVSKPDAFALKHIEGTAQHLIPGGDKSVAGDFPRVEHVTRQSGAVG